MRKVFIILLFFVNLIASATNYYVAVDGNDSNIGTLAEPFATWNHGILQLTAGDTLFIRSGIYYATEAVSISANPNEGTTDNPIVVMGYPEDATRPILDGSNLNQTSLLRVEYKSHWKINRIEIRESHDTDGVYTNFCGINSYRSNQIYFENVIVHDIDGQGFRIQDCDTIYVRDCDSYNNYDPYNNGGKADGFQINGAPGIIAMVYFDNCRTWNNSDDGWDFLDNTRGVVDSCWAWANGYDKDGSGEGFKAGLQTGPPPSEAYIFSNSIAVYNSHGGMRGNCNGQEWFIDSRWYNNVCAFNLMPGFNTSNLPGAEMNTNIWRNNISYANVAGDYWEDASTFIRDHNSWDIPLTLTDADFVSVDSTGITAPRQIDGSLPNNACYNNFLKLSDASQAINRGIDVGLDFEGDAPDLGPFEWTDYDAPPPLIATTYPTIVTSKRIVAGGFIIEDYDENIVWKGVCWNTTGTPTASDNIVYAGTGSDPFTVTISGLSANTTYYVRAYAITESGTGYGNIYTIITGKRTQLTLNGKPVVRGGIIQYIE